MGASGTWNGSSADNVWATGGNWVSSSIPGVADSGVTISNTDTAIFTLTGASTQPIAIDAGGRNLQNITFNGSGTFTIGTTNGPALLLTDGGTIQIAAGGSRVQTINAPLLLEGNYTFNNTQSTSSIGLNFGGEITTAATSGTSTLTLTTVNSGTNNVITGSIDDGTSGGKLAISKTGAGQWILSGSNSYSGGTTSSAGVLSIGNDNALGTGVLTLNNGTIQAFGGARSINNNILLSFNETISGTNDLTLSGTFTNALPSTRSLTVSNTGQTKLTGPVLLNASGTAATFTVSVNAGATVTISGEVSNGSATAGNLTKSGPGMLVLTASNSYTGPSLVNVGTLAIGDDNALGAGSLTISTSGTFQSANATAHTVANQLGTFATSGTYTFGATSGGTGDLTFTNTVASSVSTTGTSTFQINNTTSFSNPFGGGGGSLAKAGSGTMVLKGISTYTGTTTVKAGTLLVSGSLSASSAVTVGDLSNLATTAILGGSGKVGNVTLGAAAGNTGAMLSPGNGAGTNLGSTLNTGNLTVTAGSGAHLALQLGRTSAGTTAAGDVSDHVNVTGTVALDGDLQINLLTTGYSIAANDVLYLIINDSTDATAGKFVSLNGTTTTLNEGSQFGFNGQNWQITYLANYEGDSFTGGNDVALMALTSIPEPSTWALLLGGAGLMLFVRKFRLGARSA